MNWEMCYMIEAEYYLAKFGYPYCRLEVDMLIRLGNGCFRWTWLWIKRSFQSIIFMHFVLIHISFSLVGKGKINKYAYHIFCGRQDECSWWPAASPQELLHFFFFFFFCNKILFGWIRPWYSTPVRAWFRDHMLSIDVFHIYLPT